MRANNTISVGNSTSDTNATSATTAPITAGNGRRRDDPYAILSQQKKLESVTDAINPEDSYYYTLPQRRPSRYNYTTSPTIYTTISPISVKTVGPEFWIKCNKKSDCPIEAFCQKKTGEGRCMCPGTLTPTSKEDRKCTNNVVAKDFYAKLDNSLSKLPKNLIIRADPYYNYTRATRTRKTSSSTTTTSDFTTSTANSMASPFNFTTSTIAYQDLSNFTTTNSSNLYNFTQSAVSEQIIKSSNFLPLTTPAFIVLSIVGLLVGILALCFGWKCCLSGFRKKKIDKNKAVLIPLEKTVMKEQRYTTNPQYSPVPGAIPIDFPIGSVPLLNRNSITGLKKIGEGFFGEVYRGLLHSIDNEEEHVETVAIKMLKQTANKEALEDFMREVEITGSFQHPNILTLVGVCPQENSSPPWMIFEYMSFGDLADVLRNSNPEFRDPQRELLTLSPEVLLSISSQIAAGMEYLASQRFVHRDLACRNCLVGSSMTVKISDFGMSRDVYTCDYYRVGGKRMLPIRWMSPEGLSFGKFTLESDIWAYGVVLWEIYSQGKQPYYGYTNEQAMKLIVDHVLLEIPENCPNEIADIMRSCWQINPKDRLQFLDICNLLSALKERIDEISANPLPRPPPMPVTINYPLPFDDDELDDMSDDDKSDDDNYLRPISRHSSVFLEPSNSSLDHSDSSSNPYVEAIP